MQRKFATVSLFVAAPLLTLLAACGGSSHTPTPSPVPTETPVPTPQGAEPASYEAHGSVGQVWVIDAEPGQQLSLVAASGAIVATSAADEKGGLIFREVEPAASYRVTSPTGGSNDTPAGVASGPLDVTGPDDAPPQSFYDGLVIQGGYQYLETRDGTLLAINVLLPGPIDGGPYPTLVEYSGYDPANPNNPQPSTLIAQVLGYAAVGVNMRGTGCSGGAFQFFEDLQTTDGHDVIEAIAAQPWSAKVGMVGISYPGISQLFTAQRRPPHLAAIAPLSVISDTGRGTLYPGGILNNGFAYEWAEGRERDSREGGQGWSRDRLEDGDQTCIDNMKLRLQTPDIFEQIEENNFYVPEVADPVAPTTFVHRIEAPVFLGGAWQDEQTGGYFANMIPNFTGTEPGHNRFHMTNGGHTDILAPEIFSRWLEFIDLFVGERVPQRGAGVDAILAYVASSIFSIPSLELPPERFDGSETYEEALAFWKSEPPVRVLFESGGDVAGHPIPTFVAEFDEWPPMATPTNLYFEPGGGLSPVRPESPWSESFLYDTSFSQVQTLDGVDQGGPWVANPGWNWQQRPAGTNLVYTSEPFSAEMMLAGTAAVHLWVRANVPDVDLQVTLSEIRSDGLEAYIQNGWLRASRRSLDDELSTPLRPVASHLEEDAAPLPAGEFALVSIETFPFAHYFRPGSRLRIEISTPGATRPRWRWEILEYDEEVVTEIALGDERASGILLPVVETVASITQVPENYPVCSLRAQPCREAQ